MAKSNKNRLHDTFVSYSRKIGGSHETIRARERTIDDFSDFLWKRCQLRDPSSIRLKDIKAFVEAEKAKGVSIRTLQNRLSHLRGVCEMAGCRWLKDHQATNEALIGSKSSRGGTKTAISDSDFKILIEKADTLSPGLGALLRLERRLGLRSMEALRSPASLKTWMKNIKEGRPLEVVFGTKGGKKRSVDAPDRGQAYNAVRRALNVLEKNGGRWFEGAPDLKTQERIMRKQAREAGLQGQQSMHSLRYAFARERYERYCTEGLSEKEALAATSLDLGHGDGRGRYIQYVYLK